MSAATLALSALLVAGAGALFALAGDAVRRRPVASPDAGARRSLAAWWLGGALVLGTLAARNLLAGAGLLDPALHVAVQGVQTLALAVALAGLLHFMLYLLTGRRLGAAVGVVYAAFAALSFAHLAGTAWTVHVSALDARPVPVGGLSPDNLLLASYAALLVGPGVLASAAYAGLAVRLREPGPRRRAMLLAAGLVQLFALLLVGYGTGWIHAPWFVPAYQVSVLVTGAMGVLAYRPPGALAARLGWQERAPRPEPPLPAVALPEGDPAPPPPAPLPRGRAHHASGLSGAPGAP